MVNQQKLAPTIPNKSVISTLNTDELHNLARFLDALLEADMELKRKERANVHAAH